MGKPLPTTVEKIDKLKAQTESLPSMEDRMKARLTELTAARDQAREQLAGLQNQIYAIEQLLSPQPAEQAVEATGEPPDKGVDMQEGTV